ncbi:TolC family protein [Pseudomonas sp.]|uniref:TolC family protein n=1 Tax=Pseudomonas sp. TaxID=306 RepID=UPI0039C9137C
MGCAAPLMMLFNAALAEDLRHGSVLSSAASRPSMAYAGSVSLQARTLEVSLADAVYLGLHGNREIHRSYLQRLAHKFDLRVAEDGFSPRWIISSKHHAQQGSTGRSRDFTLSPKATVSNEWGTTFSLSWAQRLNQADRTGRNNERGMAFEVVQPLLRNAGRDIVTAPVRKARLSEESRRLGLQANVASTVSQIVVAYRELLKAQEQQRIARDALARAKDQLAVNDALIAAGRMAAVERLQTEANLASQELGVEEAAHQLETQRRALLHLLALDLATPLRANEALTVERVEMDHDEAMRIAMFRQPKYLQQRIAGELVDIDLKVSKNQRLWDLSLVGGASQDRHAHSGQASRTAERRWNGYAGVQLEIPIGDLTQRQQVLNAQVAVDTHALQQQEDRQRLEREIGDAIRNMDTHWRRYEIAQRGRDMSKRTLEVEREKLKVGRSSNFQVLSFEEHMRLAENAVLGALIACLNAQTALDEHLGMTLDSWEIALND